MFIQTEWHWPSARSCDLYSVLQGALIAAWAQAYVASVCFAGSVPPCYKASLCEVPRSTAKERFCLAHIRFLQLLFSLPYLCPPLLLSRSRICLCCGFASWPLFIWQRSCLRHPRHWNASGIVSHLCWACGLVSRAQLISQCFVLQIGIGVWAVC